ncbi:ABC transporter permease [Lactobacillus sp.]|uniref:ABC transporter permease n=1 Tax=Lactobacillus sp. TaxID=1591 RepID=UPI0019B19466|nr:ABC transporter permease [Lactobacillus sp.]MBD5429358.1 ABC transporter permease [Lactobacillus sp.]
MTKFSALFNELFKTKRRSVHLLILLQIVATVILTIWAFIVKFEGGEPASYFLEMMGVTSVCADVAYVVMSTWQNERVYKYQTWRLIPISATKTYLGNILSGFVAGLYLVIVQIGLLIISTLPIFTSQTVRKSIGEGINHFQQVKFSILWDKFWSIFNWGDILSVFLAFFLFAILVYSTVSTIDLSSKAIADFLPEKFNKFARFCITVVLVILSFILISNLSTEFTSFYDSLFDFNEAISVHGIWTSNATFLTLDVILSGINIWLLGAFHEGK